jgi:hypothetical protein
VCITQHLDALPGGESKEELEMGIIHHLLSQMRIVWASDDVRHVFSAATAQGARHRKAQRAHQTAEEQFERYSKELASFSGTRKQKADFIANNKGIVRQHESYTEPHHTPLILAQINLNSAYIRWKEKEEGAKAEEKLERKQQRESERKSREEERKAEKAREAKEKEGKRAAAIEQRKQKEADKEENLRQQRLRAARNLKGTATERYKAHKDRAEEELAFIRESREFLRSVNKKQGKRKRGEEEDEVKEEEVEEDSDKENEDGNTQ